MQVMPKRPTRNKRFWALVHRILARFPAAFPVQVRVIPRAKDWGWCHRSELDSTGETFVITVREVRTDQEDVNYATMADTFLHELAHILNWSHLHDQLPHAAWHDETWGAWYARLYRSFSGDK